jgi:cardiolipin synthase
MVRGASFVNKLRELEDSYRANSRELRLEEWLERPYAGRVLDNVARLTAAVQ